MASPLAADADLCDRLKAYLGYRSRNTASPPPLTEAWNHFYADNAPRIRVFLKKSGLPPADHEDCLQEVWSEVVAHLADLPYDPRRGRLSTWLITVARNTAVDMIRRRRHLSATLDEEAFAVVDSGPGPADTCESRSTRDQVRSILAELSAQVSPLSFQVFYQRTIEERSGAEVADTLGLTPEQVRFRLHRTKQKFRDLFERSATLPLSDGASSRTGYNQENGIPAQRDSPSYE